MNGGALGVAWIVEMFMQALCFVLFCFFFFFLSFVGSHFPLPPWGCLVQVGLWPLRFGFWFNLVVGLGYGNHVYAVSSWYLGLFHLICFESTIGLSSSILSNHQLHIRMARWWQLSLPHTISKIIDRILSTIRRIRSSRLTSDVIGHSSSVNHKLIRNSILYSTLYFNIGIVKICRLPVCIVHLLACIPSILFVYLPFACGSECDRGTHTAGNLNLKGKTPQETLIPWSKA